MALDHEHRHHIVGGRSSAVETDVDQQSLFAVGGGEKHVFEVFEGGHVHTLDVDVAEASVRPLLGQPTALTHPLLVSKLPLRSEVRRFDDDSPLAAVLAEHPDLRSLVDGVDEETEYVGIRQDFDAVHGEQAITLFDRDIRTPGR